jgi:hypothetical protein
MKQLDDQLLVHHQPSLPATECARPSGNASRSTVSQSGTGAICVSSMLRCASCRDFGY